MTAYLFFMEADVFGCGELTLPNIAVTKSVHTFAPAHGQDAVDEK